MDKKYFVLLFAWMIICTGCTGIPFPKNKLTACFDANQIDIKDETTGITYPVYCIGKDSSKLKPPVLLLHEITGLSSETLSYADSLSSDFTVYIPHLIGPFNWSESFTSTNAAFIRGWFETTFNGQWSGLENGNSKLSVWLRHLANTILQYHKGNPLAVIGNCVTGTVPLTLFVDPTVNIHAMVIAQPALPRSFFNLFISSEDRLSLGVSNQNTENARNSKVRIYGIRFQEDEKSPHEKFLRLKSEFAGRFIDAEICHDEYLKSTSTNSDWGAHSTIIGPFKNNTPPWEASENRRNEVKLFLKNSQTFVREDSNCRHIVK